MRLVKVEKGGETEMIQCIEMALYQSHKGRMKNKQFTEDPYSYPTSCMYKFRHLQPSLTLPIPTFQVIKGKKKKQIIFLYIIIFVFLCYTTGEGAYFTLAIRCSLVSHSEHCSVLKWKTFSNSTYSKQPETCVPDEIKYRKFFFLFNQASQLQNKK